MHLPLSICCKILRKFGAEEESGGVIRNRKIMIEKSSTKLIYFVPEAPEAFPYFSNNFKK